MAEAESRTGAAGGEVRVRRSVDGGIGAADDRGGWKHGGWCLRTFPESANSSVAGALGGVRCRSLQRGGAEKSRGRRAAGDGTNRGVARRPLRALWGRLCRELGGHVFCDHRR